MFNLDLKEYFLNRCAGMQTPAAPFLLSMPNFSYYLIYFFSPLHSCNGFSFRSVPSCTLPLFSELQKSTVLKATTWTSRSVSREEQRLLSWGLRLEVLGLESRPASSWPRHYADLSHAAPSGRVCHNHQCSHYNTSLVPLESNGPHTVSFLKAIKPS